MDISGWYRSKDKVDLSLVLQRGDLLEVKRSMYSHWAVCIVAGPNPTVVHFIRRMGPMLFCGLTCGHNRPFQFRVFQNDLWSYLKVDDLVRVNNALDAFHAPLQQDEIVERAKSWVNHVTDPYDLVFNNCEHFVNWCRYGDACSLQVRYHVRAALGIVAVLFGTTLGALFGGP